MRWNPFRRKPKVVIATSSGPTGGTFSLGDAKDIPYCAAAREIANYSDTSYLEKEYPLWDLTDGPVYSDYDPEDPPWNRRIWDPDYE